MIVSGLVSALRTLTIVPVPGPEPQRRVQALPWFVVVGAFVGMLQVGLLYGVRLLPGTVWFLAGLACTACNYAATGALHLDGLGDTADALGTTNSRQRTLEILKDPHIGSFGTIAICAVFLWRAAINQKLFESHMHLWIIAAFMLSRIMQGVLLSAIPYARPDGGKAAGYHGSRTILLVLIAQLVCVMVGVQFLSGPLRAWVPFGIGISMTAPLVAYARIRLIGITGDIVGAATELFECAFLSGVLACM